MPDAASAPRLLIVGTGHGARIHLPAAREAGFEVVGLVGTDAERTQRIAQRNAVAGAFTDLAQAIARTGAQAVTIATPPATHAPLVAIAAQAGCHVLCEKPMARNAGEAATMLEQVSRAGVVHAIGNQMRTLPVRQAIALALAEGRIGTPRMVTLIQHIPLMFNGGIRMPGWWYDAARGGGWLNASGSHMVDMVRAWLGEFASVSATLAVPDAAGQTADDGFSVHFTLANGGSGVWQQIGSSAGRSTALTRIVGSAGSLWLDGEEAWIADAQGEARLPLPGPELPRIAPSEDPRKQFLHVELPPSIRLMQSWRAAIAGQGTAPGTFATFTDGLATMQVIDAIRLSSATGRTVAVGSGRGVQPEQGLRA